MSEFIIDSDQLERLIEGIEHDTGREINKVICNGIELEKIVRCHDCRHFTPGEEEPPIDWCDYFHDEVAPIGFCAWGEENSR